MTTLWPTRMTRLLHGRHAALAHFFRVCAGESDEALARRLRATESVQRRQRLRTQAQRWSPGEGR